MVYHSTSICMKIPAWFLLMKVRWLSIYKFFCFLCVHLKNIIITPLNDLVYVTIVLPMVMGAVYLLISTFNICKLFNILKIFDQDIIFCGLVRIILFKHNQYNLQVTLVVIPKHASAVGGSVVAMVPTACDALPLKGVYTAKIHLLSLIK